MNYPDKVFRIPKGRWTPQYEANITHTMAKEGYVLKKWFGTAPCKTCGFIKLVFRKKG